MDAFGMGVLRGNTADRAAMYRAWHGVGFALQVLKSVTQRLKPSSKHAFTARLKPCPSFERLFPSLLGSVKLHVLSNLAN